MFQRKWEHGGWKESQGTDKPLWKTMSSSHHTEQKTFIEASCTNNIHTREFFFAVATFGG